jgi:hypothetical protein
MPKEGEVQNETFHLYCTDPRDGVAKFQICEPKRAGRVVFPGEPRIHLDNITVKVDRMARPFYERLELDIRINDNLILEAHARSLNTKDEDRREIHNLEFGLACPTPQPPDGTQEDTGETGSRQAEQAPPGTLSVRANVANSEDSRLVPGELLNSYDPYYFDSRRRPPEYQVHEKLYYEPCALCGRASNDPLCRCSSKPIGARPVTGRRAN